MENEFLRLPAVLARYGISRSTLYLLIRAGQFPRPFHLGRSSLWSAKALIEHEAMFAADPGHRTAEGAGASAQTQRPSLCE